jgi:drug/metabolite transporter (DMT)-like permease
MNLLITLLRFYPREWRVRYEDEFSALLEQNSLSLLDIGDIALGALDAHLRPQVAARQVSREGRPLVNTASLIRWSGMAGMIGSVLTLFGLVIGQFLADNEYPYIYDALDITAAAMFFAGVVLTLVFAIGFTVAYGRRIGTLGQIGLLIAAAGLLSLSYGGLGHLVEMTSGAEGGWWDYFVLGLFGTLLGAALFSLGGILQKTLPLLGSGLVSAAGLGAIAVLILSLGLASIFDEGTGRTLGIAAFAVCLTCFYVGMFLLGYDLWSGRRAVTTHIEPAPLT